MNNLPPESTGPRRPADWEPMAALWISWPHNRETWPGKGPRDESRIEAVAEVYRRIVERTLETHPVRILAVGETADQADAMVGKLSGVDIVGIPTNDAWIRDYGPQFVFDGDDELCCVAFRYNAWGGKYPPWDADAEAAEKIAAWLDIPVATSDLTIEGGGMDFDGNGRLLTTTSCVLDVNRNPEPWSLQTVESELRRCLGVEHIVWIDGGPIAGDDTDGHIDQLARFVDPENVVVAVAGEADAVNHDPLRTNLSQIDWWSGRTDPPVRVHPLMIPPLRHVEGRPVPQSYCNYVRLGPDRILMPTFGCEPHDDAAAILLGTISGAEVVSIDCRDLVWGLGALHCATLEQPLEL